MPNLGPPDEFRIAENGIQFIDQLLSPCRSLHCKAAQDQEDLVSQGSHQGSRPASELHPAQPEGDGGAVDAGLPGEFAGTHRGEACLARSGQVAQGHGFVPEGGALGALPSLDALGGAAGDNGAD